MFKYMKTSSLSCTHFVLAELGMSLNTNTSSFFQSAQREMHKQAYAAPTICISNRCSVTTQMLQYALYYNLYKQVNILWEGP